MVRKQTFNTEFQQKPTYDDQALSKERLCYSGQDLISIIICIFIYHYYFV